MPEKQKAHAMCGETVNGSQLQVLSELLIYGCLSLETHSQIFNTTMACNSKYRCVSPLTCSFRLTGVIIAISELKF